MIERINLKLKAEGEGKQIIVGNASERQDQAQTGYVNGYYYTYRYFAIGDKNQVQAVARSDGTSPFSWGNV